MKPHNRSSHLTIFWRTTRRRLLLRSYFWDLSTSPIVTEPVVRLRYMCERKKSVRILIHHSIDISRPPNSSAKSGSVLEIGSSKTVSARKRSFASSFMTSEHVRQGITRPLRWGQPNTSKEVYFSKGSGSTTCGAKTSVMWGQD